LLEEILIPPGIRSRPLLAPLRALADARLLQIPNYERPLAEARAAFLAARKPAPRDDGIAARDRTIPGPAGPIPIRIYSQGEATTPRPILVYFHGGGFVLGNLDSHDNVCRGFCRAFDGIVLSVDYRLSPESVYPAATDDAWAALNWAASEGGVIGGDPSRLAVAGDSAGGMLALATALRARDQGGPRLSAMVPVYPMTNLVDIGGGVPSYRSYGDGQFGLSTRDVEWFVGCYCPADLRREPYASPAFASAEGLPPALFVLAEQDVLHDEGAALANRLGEADVPTIRIEVAGVNHGFLSSDLGLAENAEIFEIAVAFLRTHFAR
jgi:acetyl esterase